MIKILIVDDHAVVRKGVRQILEDANEISVYGEASNGREAIQLCMQTDFDIALLDIALPDTNGIEVLKQLRHLKPKIRVLILSMYPEEQYALRALQAGAAGYLTKDSAPDELVEAIHKVCAGGKYVTTSLAESMAAHMTEGYTKLPHESLSDRESEVMHLLASGKSTSEIAAMLSISPKSVSTYRTRIMEKLGATNSAEIIHYAYQNRLIQ